MSTVAYSKLESDQRFVSKQANEEFKQEVENTLDLYQAETIGIATASTDPGTPTGYARYDVYDAATLTNFLDDTATAIEVTTGDLDAGKVSVVYDPALAYWTKVIVPVDLSNIYTKSEINPAKNRAEGAIDEVITPSTNLFSGSVESGYYNTTTGAPTALSTWRRSTKIPLSANTQYVIAGYGTPSTTPSVLCWNGSTFLGHVSLTTITGGKAFITPANTTLVAFNLNASNEDGLDATFQINAGNEVLPYQAYGDVTTFEIKEEALPNYYDKDAVNGLIEDLPEVVSSVTAITGDAPIARINAGENTNAPAAFPAAVESGSAFGITITPDTDSPVKDYLGYKRIFSSTKANGATDYRFYNLPIGVLRPTTISIAFWTKQADFAAIFSGTIMKTYLGTFRLFSINPTLMLAGTPQSNAGTGSPTDINTATLTASVIATQGAWIRVRLNYTSITWQGGFSGSEIPFYFLFNDATQNNKSMDFVDFTVLFNEEIQGDVLYPDPNGNYPSNVITLKGLQAKQNSNSNEINALKSSIAGECKLILSGSDFYFSSPWDNSYNLVKQLSLARANSSTSNPNTNFVSEYLAGKAGDQTISSIDIKSSGDDICPARLNGSYIGANHGWGHGQILTKAAHGKTFADIGSIYQDTVGKNFVILNIVDANNIWICSTNQAVDGYSYSFIAPTGTLTYVSDGINTGSISSYTQASLSNMLPMTSPSITKVLLDGKTEVSANGSYSCTFVDVHESYDVFDLPSVLTKITANRPGGGYSANVLFNELGADKLFRHSIVYRYMKNGTTLIIHNFRTYKKVAFNFHGFTQSKALNSGNIYVPKSLPISDGTTTYDLTQICNWTTPPAASLYLTPTYWADPLSPPDRVVNMNGTVVFQTGYLTDRGVGAVRKDVVNNSIFLNTSRKIYPMGVSNDAPIDADEFFSCVAYRNFVNPTGFPSGRSNFSWLELDGVVWIWADYHGALTDYLPVQDNWKGKKITVVEDEGNDNVKVLSDVVTDSIEIISTAGASDYGFVVLKLE